MVNFGIKIALTSIILLLSSLIGLNKATSFQVCPDVKPCNCNYESYNNSLITIYCPSMPMEEVKNAFSKISAMDVFKITLDVQNPGDFIPADIFGQIRVEKLSLVCQSCYYGNYDIRNLLRVDPNALRSSKSTLQYVEFRNIDSSRLDFDFLIGFQNFSYLLFDYVSNLDRSISTLPALPALKQLYFARSTGLNRSFPFEDAVLKTNGLTSFEFYECDLDEVSFGRLLDWILPSSTQTLQYIQNYGDRLKEIPHQLSFFQNLLVYAVILNKVDLTINRNTFYVSGDTYDYYGNTASIVLISTRLVRVEPGAFQGNYTRSNVVLSDNFLTRLEEGVFKSMLQEMHSGGYGDGYGNEWKQVLQIDNNPIDCYSDPCHLAWLLRDNRHLLDNLPNAKCKDGIDFKDVSPCLFEKCPLEIADKQQSFHIPTLWSNLVMLL